MKVSFISIILVTLSFISCSSQKSDDQSSTISAITTEEKEYKANYDTILKPQVVPSGKPNIVSIVKPKVFFIKSNTQLSGQPKRIKINKLNEIVPGKGSYELPKSVTSSGVCVKAGKPEIILAKDPYIKDHNPQNFSNYSKLQGLKQSLIRCLLQDHIGNLWIGTLGGGVSKFDGKFFTNYTEAVGLVNNRIYTMFQDDSKNIWFGTLGGGVSKFDGRSFTNYNEKGGLANNRVFSICQDRDGNMWFGTDGAGVSKFDGKTFTTYTEKNGLCNNYVLSIIRDKEGNLWMGTDAGVSKFNGKGFTNYKENEGFNHSIYSIIQDRDGNLWFGSDGSGVLKYSGDYITNYTVSEGLPMNRIFSISQDISGNFWFGTYGGGVCKFDGKAFTNFDTNDGLTHNNVICILEDKTANMWFGTFGGGLSRYNGNLFTHLTQNEGLRNSMVLSIFQDNNGDYWFATENEGVCKYDGKSYTYYTENEGLSNNRVLCIKQDQKGNLLFGTDGGGISIFNGKTFTNITKNEGLISNTIHDMNIDPDQTIWFATINGISKYDGNSFANFSKNEGLVKSRINSILKDRQGNYWLGTDGGGVYKLTVSSKDGSDTYIFKRYTKNEGLSDDYVLTIAEDNQGCIWFGTFSGGVTKYDGNTFSNFTEKDGLSSNGVYSILQDRNSNLWFGNRIGLCKLSGKDLASGNYRDPEKVSTQKSNYSQKTFSFKSYSYDDGFLGIGCNIGAIFEDRNGAIWIGTNDRLTVYHPEGDLIDTIPPNVQLTDIELFNEKIDWTSLVSSYDSTIVLENGIELSGFHFDSISPFYCIPEHLSLGYKSNFISFKFIGVTLKQNYKVKYQFKLDDVDENWNAATFKNEATYGNLPPGDYTFRIKAMNSDGYWSKESSYSFSIKPPWWKTIWFRILLVLFISVSIIAIFRWRVSTLHRQKKQLNIIVAEKTTEVVNQKKELEKINEELVASNEELNNQREELESTLTYLKKTQNKLIQSEKMASLGTLTAGIAHEVNNPLNFISGGLFLFSKLERELEPNLITDFKKQFSDALNFTSKGLDRITMIVKLLATFSGNEQPNLKYYDIHEIIDNTLMFIKHRIPPEVEISKDYQLAQVIPVYPDKFHQVIIKIIENAIFEFNESESEQKSLSISTYKEKDKAIIKFCNSGRNIPESKLLQIFDPFYTTKDPNIGIGLGLSICYTFIQEHNGHIYCENQKNGVCIIIKLPIVLNYEDEILKQQT